MSTDASRQSSGDNTTPAGSKGDRIVFRTCPLCEATCGLEITVKGGQVTRIRGDQQDVFSQGYICPKGSTLKQLHADPDRVRTPLVKKNGVFVAVSWEEAFAAVAEGFGKIWADGDRSAVAMYLGNPTAHSVAGGIYTGPMVKAFRTKNLYSASTVDQMPRHVSSGMLFGNPGSMPVPDLDRTDYLLMLGANPHESNGSLCTAPDFPGRMEKIRARGGKIVTVDPRRTKTAEASDEHIAIRPGTDALWIAAIVTEISQAGLVDLGTIAPHVAGLDETLALLSTFTADSVAAHTRVPAEVTRRIAHEFATARTAVMYGRIGTHTTEFGTLASWLSDVANIVTGNLDQPGGSMFALAAFAKKPTGKAGGRGFQLGRWASRVKSLPEVRGEYPVATLADEIETPGPGQVRGLLTFGGNPVLSCPNSDRLDKAIGSLEFMVSVDIYVNETTRHADVILPSPSALAKPQFDFAFLGLSVRNVVNYSPPMHDPSDPSEPGMAEHDIANKLTLIALGMGPDADPELVSTQIFNETAQRAGLDPDVAFETRKHLSSFERILDVLLTTGPYENLSVNRLLAEPHGIDLGPLQPRIPEVLRTESAKIDLLNHALVEDIARLRDFAATEPSPQLLLVGRRHIRSNNSWMHNIDVLVKGKPRIQLEIHPMDASALGLNDGDIATVRSATGEVHTPVKVTDTIAVGTVSLPHGWGHNMDGVRGDVARATPGANSNILTGEVIDPLSGNARLNAIPVWVALAGSGSLAVGD